MPGKVSLKQASLTLANTVSKFKTAQEGGTMSPEEVVAAIAPIIEMAATIAEVGSEIQEGVPAEVGMGGADAMPPMNNEDQNTGITATPPMENTTTPPMGNEDDDLATRYSQLESKHTQLQAQFDKLEEDNEKEKLANKYAQIFPVPMRESKIKEFMGRTGGLAILQAQVMEAESLMGGQKAIRQAQKESGIFDLPEYEDDTITTKTGGGKF